MHLPRGSSWCTGLPGGTPGGRPCAASAPVAPSTDGGRPQVAAGGCGAPGSRSVADPAPGGRRGATPKGSPLDTPSALTQQEAWPAATSARIGARVTMSTAPRGPSRHPRPGQAIKRGSATRRLHRCVPTGGRPAATTRICRSVVSLEASCLPLNACSRYLPWPLRLSDRRSGARPCPGSLSRRAVMSNHPRRRRRLRLPAGGPGTASRGLPAWRRRRWAGLHCAPARRVSRLRRSTCLALSGAPGFPMRALLRAIPATARPDSGVPFGVGAPWSRSFLTLTAPGEREHARWVPGRPGGGGPCGCRVGDLAEWNAAAGSGVEPAAAGPFTAARSSTSGWSRCRSAARCTCTSWCGPPSRCGATMCRSWRWLLASAARWI